MAFNRDLSQLANFLEVNSDGTFINIIPSTSQTNLGIGTNNPTAKLDVLGNARVSGNLSATNINASGIVTATSGFVGALTGLASSATQLATGRTIAITGDLTYTSGSFNGTGNVTGTGTLANTTVTPGSYGSSTEVATFTVDSKGRLTAAGTASVGTALTVAGDSGSENISLLSETLTISGGTNLTSSAASNTVTVNLDPNISLTSVVASGIITATSGFSGNVTGNLTGNINSSGVSTVTSLNATNINASGIVTATQFKTGASGSAIGINTNTISGPATITIDPAAVGDNTGLVVIKGDLQIDGTTTTINSTTLTVDDKNIVLGSGAANDAAADGSGITIESGNGNKTFQFEDTGDNLGSSENLNVASGKVYKVNNTEVLSNNTLGSGVVNSSLTSVGTLTNLSVGNVNSSGIVTAVTVNSTNGTITNLTGTAGTITTFNSTNGTITNLNATNINASGIITATSGFSGNVTGNLTGNINSSGVSTFTSLNITNINASGIVTATSGFSGNVTGNINSSGVSTVTSLVATNINASGIITATSGFVGALTGLASSATQLATGRTIAITGDLAYTSGSFNGTGNVTGTGTLATVNSNVGSFGSQTLIPVVTVNAKGLVTSVTTAAVGTALTVASDSGSVDIELLTETLTISGGTNLTSVGSGNTLTVNLDNNISLTSVVASGIITAAQFVTGASGSAIGINTNTISGPATITIDPSAVGDNTGAVRIKGDLFVDGTQFIVNSTTIELADFIVGIASTATSDILADGAGIKIGPDNTLTYDHTNTSLKSSENFNLASGKTYKINGTDVLSNNTLGSGVINSSLTSVGTLTNLSVGNINSSGIVTATTFVGALTGNVSGNINSSGVSTVTNLNIGGYVSIANTTGVANQILSSTGVGVSWKTFNDLLPQTRTTQTFTATANQTLFSFVYNVNFLDVFVNGVKLSSGEFTASNGSTITLSEGAFANDTVEFVSYATLGAGTGQVSSLNDLTDVTLTGITTGNLLAYNGSEFVNTSNINVTGIITATTFVGGLTGTATSTTNIPNLTGAITSVNTTTSLGSFTSLQLLTALTDETGSGSAVFATSPTLVTPALGTPSSGTLTSCTGLPLTTGVTGTLPVANGGTGVTTSTGTGSVVLSASPTFTGTVGAAAITATGDIAAANFNSTSDINLKENIRQVESASELVSKLEGVHFSWKETGKETIGVIAQQIEEHLPQLVQTHTIVTLSGAQKQLLSGDTHKTVNYNGLIGVLIEAVKEQGAQIAALQAEIEELKK